MAWRAFVEVMFLVTTSKNIHRTAITKRDHIILPLLLIKVSVDAMLEGSGVVHPPPPTDDEDDRAAGRPPSPSSSSFAAMTAIAVAATAIAPPSSS